MFILRNGKVYKKNARNGSMKELPGIKSVRVKKSKYVISHTWKNITTITFLYFDSDSEVKRFNEELYKQKIV